MSSKMDVALLNVSEDSLGGNLHSEIVCQHDEFVRAYALLVQAPGYEGKASLALGGKISLEGQLASMTRSNWRSPELVKNFSQMLFAMW